MIKKTFLLGTLFIVGLLSMLASAPGPGQNTYNPSPPPQSLTHDYSIGVFDSQGAPLPGTKISYAYDDLNGPSGVKGTEVSNESGYAKIIIKAIPSPYYLYSGSTKISFTASKDGYFPQVGSLECSSPGACYESTKLTLIMPSEYYDPAFLSSNEETGIIEDINMFTSEILLKGLIGKAELVRHSIQTIIFKNFKYLTFEFDQAIVYNSLQLTKYEVGARVFDDIVRKVLTPLNALNPPQDIYGYNIKVISSMKDFSEKYSTGENMTFEFYLPKDKVSVYKNSDITGQGLIDSSIILLDGERIDLNLS